MRHLPAPGLALLLDRRSVPPRLLREPGPADAEIALMLEAAVRAPDHGGLRPWRFILVRGAARERLGAVFARARADRDPDATARDLEIECGKPLRAPLMIVVGVALTRDHPSVRTIDQELSGACAAQAILLAAQALGYGAIWLTGSNGHDPTVKQALGLRAEDAIVGFLYLGTPAAEPPARTRPAPAELTRDWTEPLAASGPLPTPTLEQRP